MPKTTDQAHLLVSSIDDEDELLLVRDSDRRETRIKRKNAVIPFGSIAQLESKFTELVPWVPTGTWQAIPGMALILPNTQGRATYWEYTISFNVLPILMDTAVALYIRFVYDPGGPDQVVGRTRAAGYFTRNESYPNQIETSSFVPPGGWTEGHQIRLEGMLTGTADAIEIIGDQQTFPNGDPADTSFRLTI